MNEIVKPQPQAKEIARGVYAWIGVNGDSNAGVIDTGAGLAAIDAQQSADQGRAFRRSIETIAGAPVTQLINTHFHLDHTAGNVAFADVPIVAQHKTATFMNDYMGTRGQTRWNVQDADQRLRLFFGSNFNELVPSGDPLYAWFLTRVRRPGLETLELLAPNDTFDEARELKWTGGTARLTYVGPAHCDGELIIHLPEQKIAFLGDLLFVGRFPWLGDCDLNGWISCLDRLQQLDLALVVPGHGDVCAPQEMARFRTLLSDLRDAVDAHIRHGGSEDAAVHDIALPQYAGLPRYKEWLPSNLRSIYRYLKGARA